MDELDEDSEDDNRSESSSEDNYSAISSDEDYVMEIDTDDSETASLVDVNMDSAPPALENFVQEEIPSYPRAVPKDSESKGSAQRKHKRMEALLQSVESLPVTWAQHIRDFFYATDTQVCFICCFDYFSSHCFAVKSRQGLGRPGPR